MKSSRFFSSIDLIVRQSWAKWTSQDEDMTDDLLKSVIFGNSILEFKNIAEYCKCDSLHS